MKILVPIDLQQASMNALQYAMQIPNVTELHVMHVMEEGFANRGLAMYPAYMEDVRRKIEAQVRLLPTTARNIIVDVRYDPQGPVNAIEKYTSKQGIHRVVIANANKKILFKALFGNTTLGLLKNGCCDVLVIPPDCSFHEPRHVLIAVDSTQVTKISATLLSAFGPTQISIVHVGPKNDPEWADSKVTLGEIIFDQKKAEQSIEVMKVEGKSVATNVLSLARNIKAEMIVFFVRQQGIISRLFLSSTTQDVLTKTNLPLYFKK